MAGSVHEQVLAHMREMATRFAQSGAALQLPSASHTSLSPHYTALDYGKMLEAKFAFNPLFANPLQLFQGGYLCASLDEVYGPLSFMAADRPVLTIEMSTSFHRPFAAKDEAILIRAELVTKSKALLVMKANVHTLAGKLVATSTTHALIATDDQIRPKSS